MRLTGQIAEDSAWLREEQSLIAARLCYLFRQKGIDTKSVICVKIFPDTNDPTTGALMTLHGKIFQFGFNRAGMVTEQAWLDEWINITETYMQHPWRDEILAGLALLNDNQQ